MLRPLTILLSYVGIVAIPIAVISSVVLGFVWDAGFYHDGQVRYQVQRFTGLSQPEMDRVDAAIVRFFAGNESLPTALQATGAPVDVYNQKEILHMNDVRGLIQGFRTAQAVSLVAVVALLGLAAATWREVGRLALARALTFSSILTIAVAVVLGGLTLTSFDTLFLTFHEISFSNNFWELDPARDHLIQMFPFEFWYDAMLAVAFRVVVVTLILGASGLALARVGTPVAMERRWT